MGLKNICTRHFKHHYGGSSISLCNYENMIEMGPLMSENQIKESQSRVAPLSSASVGDGVLQGHHHRSKYNNSSFIELQRYVVHVRDLGEHL